MNAQYPRESTSAPRPKIGRKTNGGREITSKPLRLFVIRAGVATSAGVCPGEADGDGDPSVGEGDGDGEAVEDWTVKFAHGWGGTLAHR